MRLLPLLLIVALAGAPGCQKAPAAAKPGAAAADLPGGATPTAAAVDPQADFAEIRTRILPTVNARVPASLAAKLQFAPQFDAKSRVVALAPESWVMGDAPGTLRPAPDANLGAATMMAFGSGCDGRCAPKNWAEAFDKVEVRSLAVQQVESDEPIGKSGRVVVARSGAVRYVVAGIWKPDGARYFFCRATLDGPAIDALPAFVGACRAMDVRRWD